MSTKFNVYKSLFDTVAICGPRNVSLAMVTGALFRNLLINGGGYFMILLLVNYNIQQLK